VCSPAIPRASRASLGAGFEYIDGDDLRHVHVQGPVGAVIGRQPHALHMVAADDHCAMVSRALAAPAAAGKHLFVFGPEAISIPDALRLYCRIVHDGKPIVTMLLPVMRAIHRAFMGGRQAQADTTPTAISGTPR
jgi:uncharacterized protein YbjT (DUF2867 family)